MSDNVFPMLLQGPGMPRVTLDRGGEHRQGFLITPLAGQSNSEQIPRLDKVRKRLDLPLENILGALRVSGGKITKAQVVADAFGAELLKDFLQRRDRFLIPPLLVVARGKELHEVDVARVPSQGGVRDLLGHPRIVSLDRRPALGEAPLLPFGFAHQRPFAFACHPKRFSPSSNAA